VKFDEVKGFGSFAVDKSGVRIAPPDAYPALFGGSITYEDGHMIIVDFVYVEDEDAYEALKRDLEQLYEKEYGISKYVETYSTVVDNDDLEIVKIGWQLGVKRYGKGERIAGIVGYMDWPGYEGIDRATSERINAFLWDMAFAARRFNLDELKSQLAKRFGLDDVQAERIVRTEMANIFNKMREWAYLEKTRVKKFRWVAKADACEKCKAVEAEAKGGVTLEELKEIVRKHGEPYAREWSVHPQCRCTFVRARSPKEGWEKV
jgi:hypothetical protein